MTRLAWFHSLPLLTLCLALPTGCLFGWDNDDGDNPGNSGGDAQPRGLICEGDVSVDIEAEAEVLVEDLRGSLSEMIGCGRLTVDLASGVRDGIIDAMIAGDTDATPDGWTYLGDGEFSSNAAMASMQTRFHYAEDFEVGGEGQVVPYNVFLVDSYLEGARIVISDPLSLRGELRFDAPGPLVELLGYGANPESPISIGLGDAADLGNKVANLEFTSDVRVEDLQDDSTIMYALETQKMAATALLTGEAMRYDLNSLVATRDGIEVDVTDWDSEFFSAGRVEGSMSFDIDIEASWKCEGSISFPELPIPSGD